jgi:hypothetical protein
MTRADLPVATVRRMQNVMERAFERQHQHNGGIIVAAITENNTTLPGEVMVSLRHPDGCVLDLRISEETCSCHSDLAAAQRAADEQIGRPTRSRMLARVRALAAGDSLKGHAYAR